MTDVALKALDTGEKWENYDKERDKKDRQETQKGNKAVNQKYDKEIWVCKRAWLGCD